MKNLIELTDEELWQLFPIILSEHKDYWKENYTKEKENLIGIIGSNNIVRINHIGSTFVPHLTAKPTIDILLEIKEDVNVDALIKAIQADGYIYSYQPNNPPPHILLMKGYTPQGFEGQAFHLHIRYAGDWNELYFRDYLTVHPDVASDYGKLKQQLKEQFEHNRDAYTSAKTQFINQATKQARLEFPDRYVL